MAVIIPTILVNKFSDLEKQAKEMEKIFEYIQIDVMDGIFVPNKSFEEIDQINDLGLKGKLELHLMVNDPISEMEKWKDIKNVFSAIFHFESADDPQLVINYIRGKCWRAGVAIKPETPLSAIESILPLVDVILFMTVHPGRQGAPFVPEVLEKIRELVQKPQHPLIAVDGGVNKNNIAELQKIGVEIFSVGSALTMAPDLKKAYNELVKQLK